MIYRAINLTGILTALLAISNPANSGTPNALFGLTDRPSNISCQAPPRPTFESSATTEQVFPNLSFANPVSAAQSRGSYDDWYIAQRDGKIYRFQNQNNTSIKEVALDISSLIGISNGDNSQQWGVTSIALHPDFPSTPSIFVAYNAKDSIDSPTLSILSRFDSDDGGSTFPLSSEVTLLSVEQSAVFHHIGNLGFGPLDGYLYVGMGDGNRVSKDDPIGTSAQDLDDLRGSILRLDVDGGIPYAIPESNPFVDTGHREEIYAFGLRNPWRFGFDSVTGDLWVGDVGYSSWEELNEITAGGNYGWPIREGSEWGPDCPGESFCDSTGTIDPVLAIPHPEAVVIIAGDVYRGTAIPALEGVLIFNNQNRWIRVLLYDQQGNAYSEKLTLGGTNPTGYAVGADNELYYFNARQEEGFFWKLVPTTETPSPGNFPQLLSQTGCVDASSPTQVNSGVIPYDVAVPLWSDGADKKRWMAIPDDNHISIDSDGDFDFPIGTVLIKEFSFEDVPFETRLFVRHTDGYWGGYSYEWNVTGTDAELLPGRKTKLLPNGVSWTYPGRQDCFVCHTEEAGGSLGPEVAQLNFVAKYSSTGNEANQLQTLDHIGMFDSPLSNPIWQLPSLAPISDEKQSLPRRARSYLHSNCSMCHQPGGSAQATIDLQFNTDLLDAGMCLAPPQNSDFGISNAKIITPKNPASSILSIRMHTRGLDQMPPLATNLLDEKGTSIIDRWITSIPKCKNYIHEKISPSPSLIGDFDGDSIDEIFTKNATNGSFGVFKMGRAIVSEFHIPNAELIASGNFNGDEIPDVLLLTAEGFQTYTPTGVLIGNIEHYGSDIVKGIGDFDGNGIDDILFERSTKSDSATKPNKWIGDATRARWIGPVGYSTALVIGIGDFDGDGDDDILFELANGKMKVIDGVSREVVSQLDLTNYEVEAIGDFSGNGREDLLLTEPGGDRIVVDVETGSIIGQHIGRANAVVKGIGDFNGDGFFEVIYREKTGVHTIRSGLNGQKLAKLGGRYFESFGAGDFDGDNQDELLLQNSFGVYRTMNLDRTAASPKGLPIASPIKIYNSRLIKAP